MTPPTAQTTRATTIAMATCGCPKCQNTQETNRNSKNTLWTCKSTLYWYVNNVSMASYQHDASVPWSTSSFWLFSLQPSSPMEQHPETRSNTLGLGGPRSSQYDNEIQWGNSLLTSLTSLTSFDHGVLNPLFRVGPNCFSFILSQVTSWWQISWIITMALNCSVFVAFPGHCLNNWVKSQRRCDVVTVVTSTLFRREVSVESDNDFSYCANQFVNGCHAFIMFSHCFHNIS